MNQFNNLFITITTLVTIFLLVLALTAPGFLPGSFLFKIYLYQAVNIDIIYTLNLLNIAFKYQYIGTKWIQIL